MKEKQENAYYSPCDNCEEFHSACYTGKPCKKWMAWFRAEWQKTQKIWSDLNTWRKKRLKTKN